jgi:hypothetical protein
MAKVLKELVADRDAVSDSLNYVKMKIDEHVITAMREVVCDAVMGMTTTAMDDLREIHTKIRQCIPSDMIPHKAAYNDLLSQCHEYNAILHGIKMKFPTTSNPSGSSSSSSSGSAHPHEVRLPRLDVPHFDGNLLEWVTFRDMFTSMVGNSTSLSPGQKLAHLKSVLNGEPLRLINSLLICDANYLIAWDALSNRYTNDREYLFAILSRFMGQPDLHHPTSTSLRAMVDITQECIRSLAVLAIPMDKGLNAFIMFLTTNKLDATSRGLWEQRLMDTSIPSLEDLLKFVEQRARALSAESSVYPRSHHPLQQQSKPEERKRVMNAHNNINTREYPSCKVCKEGSHPLFKCEDFRGRTTQQRFEIVKTNNLCFNCLTSGHGTSKCSSSGRCRVCQQQHHTLLHQDRDNSSSGTSSSREEQGPSGEQQKQFIAHTMEEGYIPTTMLATALVKVTDGYGTVQLCRALLDGGSTATFLSESCLHRLGLQRQHTNAEVVGISSASVGRAKGVVALKITSNISSQSYKLNALVLPKITSFLPAETCNKANWPHLNGLELADPDFNKPGSIDLLLGSDIFWNLLQDGRRSGPSNAPVALRSTLGWLVAGNLDSSSKKLHVHVADVNLDSKQQQFWELEAVPVHRSMSVEEKCESDFATNHTRDATGRFTVAIPWKAPSQNIGVSDREPHFTNLMSKKRVAPAKKSSLPRLELCEAILLAQLMSTLQKTIKRPITRSRMWTDSTIVLGWINKSPQTLQTFVANRVTEVTSELPPNSWFHVPGVTNPADCASRGITPSELLHHHCWKGPEVLRDEAYDPDLLPEEIEAITSEVKKTVFTAAARTKSDVSLFERYSRLSKILRITAWIQRLANKCKLKPKPKQSSLSSSILPPLTPDEINNAMMVWIRITQEDSELTCLKDGKVCPTNSSILSLSPQLDEVGVLRDGGRLRAPLPRDHHHPILSRPSRLTTLIIWDRHSNNCHAGAQLLQSIIQQQFWIPRGRDAIRCLNSRRLTPVSSEPIDLEALTLGHFLIGIPMKSNPDPDLSSSSNSGFLAAEMQFAASTQDG